MQSNPREYTIDLYAYVDADDPIQQLHAAIGKRLSGLGTLRKTCKVNSPNVRGDATENQEWELE
jgi:hypothetical protein